MRGKIELPPNATQDEAMALAMAQETIVKFVENASAIKKVIYVPGKLLNLVAAPAKKSARVMSVSILSQHFWKPLRSFDFSQIYISFVVRRSPVATLARAT